mgnify:CR=1 FL=1
MAGVTVRQLQAPVLPPNAVQPGVSVNDPARLVGVLADFGCFRWKAKRRRERVLVVAVQSLLSSRKRLGVQPVLVTRVLPIAHRRYPTSGDDLAPYGDPSPNVSTVSYRRPPPMERGYDRTMGS